MMGLLVAYKPEDAVAILQGKEPLSLPPRDDLPMDERDFAMMDLYFHIRPPGLEGATHDER